MRGGVMNSGLFIAFSSSKCGSLGCLWRNILSEGR